MVSSQLRLAAAVLRIGSSLLTWCAVVTILGAAAFGFYYYHRIDEELRQHVQAMLAEGYPGLSVSVGSARLLDGEGIRIRDISLVLPAIAGEFRRSELAFVDEIFVRCNPSVTQLLQRQLPVQQIIIRRMLVRAARDPDGSWNIAHLWPLPQFHSGQQPPPITVENATVELIDRRALPPRVFTLQQIHLQLVATRAANGPGQPPIVAAAKVQGTLTADCFRHASLQGSWDGRQQTWNLQGKIENLQFTRQLLHALPRDLTGSLPALQALRADATVAFHVRGGPLDQLPQFAVTAEVVRGRYDSEQLPHPLTDLRGRVELTHEGWRVEDLQATCGETRLVLTAGGSHYRRDTPWTLQCAFRDASLNRQIVEVLPEQARHLWALYQPLGSLSGQVQAAFDGSRWTYETDVQCTNLSFTYARFPYPFTHCRGSIHLRQNQLDVQLQGRAGGAPVTIRSHFDRPGPAATGWCHIQSQAPIPINDALISAFPEQPRRFFQELRARGKAQFELQLQRDRPDPAALQMQLTASIQDGWINYARFPYPIQNIRGRVTCRDGIWSFQQLEGVNDSCTIHCNGSWQATAARRPLQLIFTAQRVPLDEELKRALAPQQQEQWQQLNPRGQLDQLVVELHQEVGYAPPEITVHASQFEAATTRADEGVQLQPVWFPLALRDITGQAHYRDGVLSVPRLSARHGRLQLAAAVRGVFEPSGRWRVDLNDLVAQTVQPHEELLAALPPGLEQALRALELDGTFALSGAASFTRASLSQAPVASWNLTVDIDQGRFSCGVPLHNVFGQLTLHGSSNETRFQAQGTIDLDSTMYEDVQLTEIQGPIWIGTSRVVLGSRVPTTADDPPSQPLSAKLYGGQLRLDGDVSLAGIPRFALTASVEEVDAASLSRDLHQQDRLRTGQLTGRLQLSGSSLGRHTFRGTGNAQLTNANIGESPLVLALIQRLSSGRPDTSMFDRSEVRFRVEGEHIYFDPIELAGDAITMKGRGEIGLDRRISLDFYTLVGREQLWAPLVRPLVGEASRQILLVHVDGSLDEPRTTQEVLPGLNETLQQLFPELARTAGAEDRRGPPPRLLDARRLLPRR